MGVNDPGECLPVEARSQRATGEPGRRRPGRNAGSPKIARRNGWSTGWTEGRRRNPWRRDGRAWRKTGINRPVREGRFHRPHGGRRYARERRVRHIGANPRRRFTFGNGFPSCIRFVHGHQKSRQTAADAHAQAAASGKQAQTNHGDNRCGLRWLFRHDGAALALDVVLQIVIFDGNLVVLGFDKIADRNQSY